MTAGRSDTKAIVGNIARIASVLPSNRYCKGVSVEAHFRV